jgi:hypothetical protein
MQGVAAAELSFQNALWYTKERRAFRALDGTKDPSAVADPIIVHPDIRKMLLTQKAIAEGGRSMIYECALLADKVSLFYWIASMIKLFDESYFVSILSADCGHEQWRQENCGQHREPPGLHDAHP